MVGNCVSSKGDKGKENDAGKDIDAGKETGEENEAGKENDARGDIDASSVFLGYFCNPIMPLSLCRCPAYIFLKYMMLLTLRVQRF